MPQLATEEFPATAFRVGHRSGVIHFAEIDAVDAANTEQGGRFDVVGGGVLYCATTKTGAYKELLALFRPSVKTYLVAEGETLMAQGSMPRSWREARALAEFSLEARRLTFAYRQWSLLAVADGEHVARQWFIGGNPHLSENTPITAIREDRHGDVAGAVDSLSPVPQM